MLAACWLNAHISISCSNRSTLVQDALVCAGIPTGMARFFSWRACASPPHRTPRMDFAWPFDVPVADPIRGQSSTD